MTHDYTDEEIKQARDRAMSEPSFKTGIAFLRAFLAALPPDQAERPQAQPEPAQPWTPAVGDTVRLKSGGPVMTVNELDEETHECECVSMSQGCIQRFLVFAACLTPAQP